VKELVKEGLTRLGARSSVRPIRALNGIVNYLEVGRWMKARGFETAQRLRTRDEVFQTIAEEVAGEQVLYLEFGVHTGVSLRRWSELLRQPDARLNGFDSFEGLPETWSFEESAGHFSTNSVLPQFDDPRVTLIKGWFEDTLPGYELPPHERLVVAIDSDLYSSAAFVLQTLQKKIVPGSYVYFDEFHDRAHELRAFSDYLDRTGFEFRLVAATRELTHVAFLRKA